MTAILENTNLRLDFDRNIGGLTAIANKLTGETYAVTGDTFVVETTAFRRTQAEMEQVEWGRANVEYLLVRHDLFDWPGKGKVDGSAHLVDGECGLILLFNPSDEEQTAEFALTPESTGFTGTRPVEISQEYPASERRETCQPGATVRWPVPPDTAMVLKVAVPLGITKPKE